MRYYYKKHIEDYLVLPFIFILLAIIIYVYVVLTDKYVNQYIGAGFASVVFIILLYLLVYELFIAKYILDGERLTIVDNFFGREEILISQVKKIYYCQDYKRNTRSGWTLNDKFLEIHTTCRYKPYRIAPKNKSDFLDKIKLLQSDIIIGANDEDPFINTYYTSSSLPSEIKSKWKSGRLLVKYKYIIMTLITIATIVLVKVIFFTNMSWDEVIFKIGKYLIKKLL